jgi:hypothetical protein
VTASIVYILCTLTSGVCAVLLLRSYVRARQRLLFWSGVCFIGLCINNLMVFIDIVLLPAVDLSVWRIIPGLLGMAALCYGLIVEVQ